LQSSGNIFPDKERRLLGKRGAVGDICLRLIDAEGRAVPSDVDKRVIGVTLEQLARSDRSVGVAGGPRKYEAIRAALLGHWVNVLITDQVTAERLIADSPTASSAVAGAPSRSTA
jgi:DNA-binding transcriptional regulator LsrR (DeoR family)